MKLHLILLTFMYLLTNCAEKSKTTNDQHVNTITVSNTNDTIKEKFNDGWPIGVPKDTIKIVPLKTYSNKINDAICESVSKKNNSQKMDIHILEVYRCRIWDGEKWYTSENDYSVLVTDENSIKKTQWIIPIEYSNGKWTVWEWTEKH